jgi:hypothetical protein
MPKSALPASVSRMTLFGQLVVDFQMDLGTIGEERGNGAREQSCRDRGKHRYYDPTSLPREEPLEVVDRCLVVAQHPFGDD